jgi:hypothetical protein
LYTSKALSAVSQPRFTLCKTFRVSVAPARRRGGFRVLQDWRATGSFTDGLRKAGLVE